VPPPENFEKLNAQRRFPAISEAERHTYKMHVLAGKFHVGKTLRSDKKAI
jgi:hypothetical protein